MGRGVFEVIFEDSFEGRQARHLPLERFLLGHLVGQGHLGVGGAAQQAQGFAEDPDRERVDPLRPVVPEVFHRFTQPGLDHHLGLDAVAQPLHGAVQRAQGGGAERAGGLAQIAGEAEEADRLRGEEMAQRRLARRLRAAEQMRQALLPVQVAEAARQVDPVPGLFDLIAREAALELTFENPAGGLGADLGQRTHLNDVVHAGAQTRLDRFDLAAFEQHPEARFHRLHGRFIELPALEQLDVLPRHRRQLVPVELPPGQVPAQQQGADQQRRQAPQDQDHLRHVVAPFSWREEG